MSDRKVICSFTFNYDEINFTTLCGNVFNVKQIGSITTSNKNSEILIHVNKSPYRVDQETHEYILNFLYSFSSFKGNN